MEIELTRATFRSLVKLYVLSLVVSVVAFAVEYVVWSSFIDAFDQLLISHFGEPSDLLMFSLLAFLVICFIAHLVAAYKLRQFRRWSRSLFWMSLIPMIAFAFVPGFEFRWVGPLSSLIEVVGMALMGAILLLAYSKNHGARWFGTSAERAEI